MKKAGRIKTWNTDKGYGFIDIHAELDNVFCHASALRNRGISPKPGDRVIFELSRDAQGRTCAVNVNVLGAPPPRTSVSPVPLLFGCIALSAFIVAGVLGALPPVIGWSTSVMSALAVLAYYSDKQAASRNARRTPEHSLHLLALAGGWPGALIAQQLFRHKNRKTSFQVTFWSTVALHCAAVAAWVAHSTGLV
ncbi:DUF1294 domain-containing protein [Imbroritus primus]|uniref:DUF1294 domain-containing protein n=1 Tax=Imbroritus primus TaxID=3058603 RepID=A0ACD3SU41_9BURK|nr:DUF1294 domain-containing protein [Burkholderiaceae bacterium PBA]